MAVYPPSAARGFMAEKLGISYDDVKSVEFYEGADNKFIVKYDGKEYIIEGRFTPPPPIAGLCGGGKWDFEILEEKGK
jgi:hypothetical protein